VAEAATCNLLLVRHSFPIDVAKAATCGLLSVSVSLFQNFGKGISQLSLIEVLTHTDPERVYAYLEGKLSAASFGGFFVKLKMLYCQGVAGGPNLEKWVALALKAKDAAVLTVPSTKHLKMHITV